MLHVCRYILFSMCEYVCVKVTNCHFYLAPWTIYLTRLQCYTTLVSLLPFVSYRHLVHNVYTHHRRPMCNTTRNHPSTGHSSHIIGSFVLQQQTINIVAHDRWYVFHGDVNNSADRFKNGIRLAHHTLYMTDQKRRGLQYALLSKL